MGEKKASTSPGTQTFRSGVAARLAGIPVETLRVWERRYGVVGPRLSARGQRQYTPAEVRRLGLIKQLLDQGQSIGTVAKLTTPALIAMQSTVRSLTAEMDGSDPQGDSRRRGGPEAGIEIVLQYVRTGNGGPRANNCRAC
jgi:MerR HTH family regulatory protein